MSTTATVTPIAIVRKTLVFYFTHNLDASLAAKTLQASLIAGEHDHACRMVPLSVQSPDSCIAQEVRASEGVTDICVLGYCPEDFTTLDLAESFPAMGISYFLYENNIQFGDKLAKMLRKKESDKRVQVFKPSSFTSADFSCGNSICSMLIEVIGHTADTVDYGRGCRTAMAAVSRWYTREETSMKDLNIAWALRYDESIRDWFAGSDMDLSTMVEHQSAEVQSRTRALLDTIYNTMAVRRMTIQENFKLKNHVSNFRTFVVGAEHTHDVYRRVIVLWDNFIIVNRLTTNAGLDGYLVSVAVGDRTMRAPCITQLGVNKFWMEGEMAVGFTQTNPLV